MSASLGRVLLLSFDCWICACSDTRMAKSTGLMDSDCEQRVCVDEVASALVHKLLASAFECGGVKDGHRRQVTSRRRFHNPRGD
jgi:hypothetical protein